MLAFDLIVSNFGNSKTNFLDLFKTFVAKKKTTMISKDICLLISLYYTY